MAEPKVNHVDEDSDDGIPQLSALTLAALNEFYSEQQKTEVAFELLKHGGNEDDDNRNLSEDWQLSQFWYDDETADCLAKELIRTAGVNGRIACVSCPTVYRRVRQLKSATCKVTLLEYDERFSIFHDDFVFYDYKSPLQLPTDFREKFDIVIADPPFLSEECFTKVACTIRFLSKGKIIVCTGAVMEEFVKKLLLLKTCKFVPKHVHNLGNAFSCYANYELDNHILKCENSDNKT